MRAAGVYPWKVELRGLIAVGWAFLYTARDYVKSGAILTALYKYFL